MRLGKLRNLALAVLLLGLLSAGIAQARTHRAVRGASSAKPFAPVCTRTITGNYTGSVIVRNGQTLCIINAKLIGSVTVLAGGGLLVRNSTIVGSVVTRGASFVTICGAGGGLYTPAIETVVGSVTISGTTGPVTVGGTPGSGCAPNQIGGALNLLNNQGGTTAFGNVIGSSLTARGNINGLLIGGNSINGSLYCSSNVPPPTNGGVTNTVVGTKTGQCVAL